MRLTHKATDTMPDFARLIMIAGFRDHKTYRAIAQELTAAGVNIAERTIARRRADWAAEEQRSIALMALGKAGLVHSSWTLEEFIDLIETLDLEPAYQLRARKRVQSALGEFLKNPSAQLVHALETELLRFRMQSLVSQARA